MPQKQSMKRSTRRRPANPADQFQEHYPDLRRMASRQLRTFHPHPTLETTELLDETYIRLAEHGPRRYAGRGQFFESAKRAMNGALVDRHRRTSAKKRWGDCQRVELEDVLSERAPPAADFGVLHDAISRLSAVDSGLARIVRLRYFEGYSVQEIAGQLKRSYATVRRHSALANAWLRRELNDQNDCAP